MLNSYLSVKVGGQITNYSSVENLAYDETNKKLMLKVEGADTPIPFNNKFDKTLLWSTTASSFSGTLTTNQSMLNFDYIEIRMSADQNRVTTFSYIIPTEDIVKFTGASNGSPYMAVGGQVRVNSSIWAWSRLIIYNNATQLTFNAGSPNGVTNGGYPIAIYGLKL